MGFSKEETNDLVYRWRVGMKDGMHKETEDAILSGLEHHGGSIIETERYKKGGFHKLYKEFGICNAARYYGPGLKHQLAFMEDKNMLYIQAIMATGDHSGAMLGPGVLTQLLWNMNPNTDRKGLEKNTTLRAIEVQDQDELTLRKRRLMKKYGQNKVSTYFLFGHSDSYEVTLGQGTKQDEYLTIQDIKRLDVFGVNSREHVKHPTIIMCACSTGRLMAKQISELVQARVYAPTGPAYIKYIDTTREDIPKIKGVVYSEPSVVYDCGKLVEVVDAAKY